MFSFVFRDAIEDPCYIYSVLEPSSAKVRDCMKHVSQKLMDNEILLSISADDGKKDVEKLYRCKCGAVMNSYEVFRQHTLIFHSKHNSTQFDHILSKLHQCYQLDIPFDVTPLLGPKLNAAPPFRKDRKSTPTTVSSSSTPTKQKKLLPKVVPSYNLSSTTVPGIVLKASEPSASDYSRQKLHPLFVDRADVVVKPSTTMFQTTTVAPVKKKIAPPVVVNTFSLLNPEVKRQPIGLSTSYVKKPTNLPTKQPTFTSNPGAKNTIVVSTNRNTRPSLEPPVGLSMVRPIVSGKPVVFNSPHAYACAVPRVIHVVNNSVVGGQTSQKGQVISLMKPDGSNIQITRPAQTAVIVSKPSEFLNKPVQSSYGVTVKTLSSAESTSRNDFLGQLLQNQKIIRFSTPTKNPITIISTSTSSVTLTQPIASNNVVRSLNCNEQFTL